MNEWFKAGFFAMSLIIKAGPDGTFTTLGKHITIYILVHEYKIYNF